MQPYRRTISLSVAVVMALGLGLPAAWGHATLLKSIPASGASLAQTPGVIRAWFSEPLAVKGTTLKLFDVQKKLLASGGVDAAVAKHDVLKLTPPHLMPGSYAVEWYVISADDGDVRRGSFKFTVKAAAQTMAPSMAALPPLTLVAPADKAQVKNPVTLVIETPGDIEKLTMGGGMAGMSGMSGMGSTEGGFHLHILVDSQVIMPTAKELTKVAGTSRYTYRLASLSPGPHAIKVFWADNKTHAAMGTVHAATCMVMNY